jgi:predicted acyl esterase
MHAWMRRRDVSLPRHVASRLGGIVKPRTRVGPRPAGIAVDWDVPVTVRDGTVLRANVFRPAGGGRHPVILCAHPYGKDALPKRGRASAQYRMLRQPATVAFSALTTWEAPDPAFWVPRGYAVVNADLRGCGRSGGVGALLSRREAEDCFDLVEWAARQPWSSGRVGMNGVSYLAMSQYGVAALHPPSLHAICPWEGLTDVYRDLLRPGGVREDGFIRIWSRGLRRNRLAYDIRAEQLARPLRDDWWEALVPELEAIRAPMLVCGSFSDHNLHSQGSFRAFERAGSERKWLYTHRGGKWATYYSPEALAAQLRFFERFLKDEGGDEPPVRLAVHDTRDAPAEVRHEQEWPLARTEWRELFAHPGRLAEDGPGAGAVRFGTRDGDARFAWTVGEPLELSGPMALRVAVELVGAADCNLFVGIEKWRGGRFVCFEGSYGFGLDHVTSGWLKLSHRALDSAQSRPFGPVHTHTEPRPVKPGEVVTAEIALRPSATLFRPGDELHLVVRGRWPWARNPLTGAFPAAYEASPDVEVVLHLESARLLIPRVAR